MNAPDLLVSYAVNVFATAFLRVYFTMSMHGCTIS